MSKIVVENIEISNDPTIVDSCRQLILKSEEEIMDYIEYLTCTIIDPRPEDARERFSHHFLHPPSPSALNPSSPQEAMRIMITQFPKRWRNQISEVVWERDEGNEWKYDRPGRKSWKG